MIDFARLRSDGSAEGTGMMPAKEERSAVGEEFLWTSLPLGPSSITVTEETALRLSPMLATATVLATDVATLPLKVYQRTDDKGSRREAREHAVYKLLNRSPNRGRSTPVRWRKSHVFHAVWWGNGFAEIQRLGKGTPYALHLLTPKGTRAEDRQQLPGYRLGNGGWLEASNVLHVAGLSFDGQTGYNFIRLMSQAIGLALGAENSAANYFENGAEPGGVIETPKKLTKEAASNLRDSWEAKHRGPGNRHRTAVLEEGAAWKPTSVDPEKSQLLETRKFEVVDLARPWRVPPHKIGDFSQAHLANIDASNLDYLMTALIGWLVEIEEEYSLKLFTEAEWDAGFYVEHDVNALLRGDAKSRAEFYGNALDRGWMNRDEVRKRENLNPIGEAGGGEKYLVQAQFVPLETAGDAMNPDSVKPSPAKQPKADPAGDAGGDQVDAQRLQLPAGTDPIFDLKRLLNDVALGELPADTVKQVIAATFDFDDATIDAMLAPLVGFTPASVKGN